MKRTYIDVHCRPSADLDNYLEESSRTGQTSDSMSHYVVLRFKVLMTSKIENGIELLKS